MTKRILAIVLALVLALGICACGSGNGNTGDASQNNPSSTPAGEDTEVEINGITYHKAGDMTTENITLTYMHFDQDETVKYLADRFMQIYPNITVKTQYENVSTYGDTLLTLVSSGKSPDIIMYSDADFALSNFLLADISEYWNADPEVAGLADTVKDPKVGTFGTFMTDKRYAVPVKFFPSALYIDRNVLKKLNIEAPGQDWTWSEMINLVKNATVLDSPDGMAYYGLGYYNRLDSLYGIAARQDIIGEFGFNGDSFDLGVWAVGEQDFADLKLGGYIAPQPETQAMEDWMGDWEAWCGSSGHVALFTEAFWTFQGTWNTEAFEQYNLDIVPYVIPAVSEADASSDHHSIATIDFGGLTTACQHPREAYELLKFMSFGVDGWKTRIELYNDETKTNASGLALKYDVMPVPITTNQEVWDAYIPMFCKGMDDEHVELWRNYFKSALHPIPFGWTSIAGYWNYCDEYFNSIGIHDLVDGGTAKAADYADEATRKANYYHAVAMLNYFGKTGYNVLTDEQIAKYESLRDSNS